MKLKIKKLTIEDLDKMVTLQKKINDSLADDEKHFILPKSRKEFFRTLTNSNYHVAGIFDGEELVGQATVGLPQDGEKRDLSEYGDQYKNSEIAIYKTIIVNPEYRKHGFMKKMLEYFESGILSKERKVALIQIAVDNPASWINAMRHGMEITKVGLDPEDNAKVLYLEKNINGKLNTNITYEKGYKFKLGENIHKNAPILFNKMYMLSKTMAGREWDKETNSIVWYPKSSLTKTNDKLIYMIRGVKINAKYS